MDMQEEDEEKGQAAKRQAKAAKKTRQRAKKAAETAPRDGGGVDLPTCPDLSATGSTKAGRVPAAEQQSGAVGSQGSDASAAVDTAAAHLQAVELQHGSEADAAGAAQPAWDICPLTQVQSSVFRLGRHCRPCHGVGF